ncbi:Tropomodulin [Necator americanus]|uniref:Tropomodulin n=1 Tax=Necator americanus TaxID=51031 RepID=W2TV34_NECAM|nr:Tropomodulin [Necator americanus]ETN85504.1 Tropomodulin [Necator americanus]
MLFSYYSEEKTFSAPFPKSGRHPPISQAKLNGKGLKDLDDHDIDGLLSNLSIDELEDLNNDFDPDDYLVKKNAIAFLNYALLEIKNSMLPPSQRCRDQTNKTPTGPFKRDHLLKFLEEQAKNEKDWEDVVPFSPGIKRGKVWEGDSGQEGGDDAISGIAAMEMPIELDLDDEEEEFEAALDHAPERDLVDLAGILGMHNILNQPQYYNALKGKQQDDSTGTTFAGVIRGYEPKETPDEPDNETDVDDCITRLEENDEDMKEVNINNMKRVSKERIRKLITAACASKHITKLSMANTAISDSEARGLLELLETSPSLKILNIESNFITPELLAKLLRATLVTQCLTEFRAENQRQAVLGNQIEMDMMLSVEENQSLLRVGVAFQSMEARHRVSEALEKNYERVRLRRLGKED